MSRFGRDVLRMGRDHGSRPDVDDDLRRGGAFMDPDVPVETHRVSYRVGEPEPVWFRAHTLVFESGDAFAIRNSVVVVMPYGDSETVRRLGQDYPAPPGWRED